jgi:hypothetical protein
LTNPQDHIGASALQEVSCPHNGSIATGVEIAPESLVPLRRVGDQYELDLIVYHTGLQDDNFTPGSSAVHVAVQENISQYSTMKIEATHTQDNPWLYQGMPIPGGLFFYAQANNGATLRVRKIIRWVGSSFP